MNHPFPAAAGLGRGLGGAARGAGARARSVDPLMAATAHAHSARLHTRDAGDFRGLDGLVDVVAV